MTVTALRATLRWRSKYADEEITSDEDMMSNDLTPEKHVAYEWITEGCYPYY